MGQWRGQLRMGGAALAVWQRRLGLGQSEFRWPSLVRLGPNDYQGRYAEAEPLYERYVLKALGIVRLKSES